MSYQVLARKWRPKRFEELVGQEHVVTVLVNALAQQRLHHAYLFTGTRGVGKTTIARIFAKSLNCEQGITATPCGQCDTCQEIDQGRFIDLLEIDAASKTKVDDTRELLDNVQYAPTRGRYKVYLIDEVHMLSRHSFNALLKTLEEPPEHVKFILATTDPQKLPVTVLSRCLQFHLKALTVNQIESKLVDILSKEQVTHQAGTLTLLAKAARGSMRDSLSLTDQAIAQGQGNIVLANIVQMLGGIDQNWIYKIVIALLKQDGEGLMALTSEIASYAPSYSRLFAELIQLFHQIAILQMVDQHFDVQPEHALLLKKFSQAISPENVQLYYQICVNGRKDLPYAADEQAAFDMTLLRLFAFKPMQLSDTSTAATTSSSSSQVNVIHEFDDINLASPDTQKISTQAPTQAPNQLPNKALNKEANKETVNQADNTQGLVTDEVVNESTVNESTVNEVTMNDAVADEDTHSAELSQEMLHIEQQATQLHAQTSPGTPEMAQAAPASTFSEQQASTATAPSPLPHIEPPRVEEIAEATVTPIKQTALVEPPLEPISVEQNQAEQAAQTFESPISAALAGRNMLRSRKKQLEQQTKKPSDAKERHTNTAATPTLTDSDTAPIAAKKVDLPAPEQPYQAENIDPAVVKKANQVDQWAHMIDEMELAARLRQLAIHATIDESSTDSHLVLSLDRATRHLYTEVAQQQLQQTISQYLSKEITVTINLVEETVADPYQIQSHINDKRYDYAKEVIAKDDIVQALQQHFQATVDEQTISAI